MWWTSSAAAKGASATRTSARIRETVAVTIGRARVEEAERIMGGVLVAETYTSVNRAKFWLLLLKRNSIMLRSTARRLALLERKPC